MVYVTHFAMIVENESLKEMDGKCYPVMFQRFRLNDKEDAQGPS